jgi:hypothetical protein
MSSKGPVYYTSTQVDPEDPNSWRVDRWDGYYEMTVEREGLTLIEAADDVAAANQFA